MHETNRLWGSWSIVEHVDEPVEIDGLGLWRVGITASTGDVHVTGSAAGIEPALTTARAEGELMERAALLDAIRGSSPAFALRDPDGTTTGSMDRARLFDVAPADPRWAPARSNGVALASTWATACHRARLELVERDRVLRSWFGLAPPPRPIDPRAFELPALPGHRWAAARVDGAGSDADVEVIAIVGFPTDPWRPLLRGFGAGGDLAEAGLRACRECLQSLAFLFDEPVPTAAPPATPTPMFHLDWYLWPGARDALARWMDGDIPEPRRASVARVSPAPVHYVDLTPESLRGRACVAKACSDAAFPLVFGPGHPALTELVDDLGLVHPIA